MRVSIIKIDRFKNKKNLIVSFKKNQVNYNKIFNSFFYPYYKNLNYQFNKIYNTLNLILIS